MDRRPPSSASNPATSGANIAGLMAAAASTGASTTVAQSPAASSSSSSTGYTAAAPLLSTNSTTAASLPTSSLVTLSPNIEINGIMAPYELAMKILGEILVAQSSSHGAPDEIFTVLNTYLEDNAAYFRNLATTVAQRVLNMALHAHLKVLQMHIDKLEQLSTDSSPLAGKIKELVAKLKEYKACIDSYYDPKSTNHPIIPLCTGLSTFIIRFRELLIVYNRGEAANPQDRKYINTDYTYLVHHDKNIREAHATGQFIPLLELLKGLQVDLLKIKNAHAKQGASFWGGYTQPAICAEIDTLDTAVVNCLREYGEKLSTASAYQMSMLTAENRDRLLVSRSQAPSRAGSPPRTNSQGIFFTPYAPTAKDPTGKYYLMPNDTSKFFEQFCLSLFASPLRRELIWFTLGDLKRRGEPLHATEAHGKIKRALVYDLLTKFDTDCGTLVKTALPPELIELTAVLLTHIAKKYSKDYFRTDVPIFAEKEKVAEFVNAMNEYLPQPIANTKTFNGIVMQLLSGLFSDKLNKQGKLACDPAMQTECVKRLTALLETHKIAIDEGIKLSLQPKQVSNGMVPK